MVRCKAGAGLMSYQPLSIPGRHYQWGFGGATAKHYRGCYVGHSRCYLTSSQGAEVCPSFRV